MPKKHEGRQSEGSESWMGSGSQEKKLNINTASADEIHDMCDVGPSTAESLVKAREDEPFDSIDDISRVPGIADKTIEKMKSHGCYAGR